MKGKYYIVQIIPEDSKEIKKYRVNTKWFTLLKILLVVIVVAAGFTIYNAGRIGHTLVNYEKIRRANAQLVKQNANYEELFSPIRPPKRSTLTTKGSTAGNRWKKRSDWNISRT